jgi:hypothetical protein
MSEEGAAALAEALAAEDLSELADDRVKADFEALHRAIERLEFQRLRLLAQIDRRRLFATRGHLSSAAWLVATYRVGWPKAKADVRLAQSLDGMPVACKAMDAGQISLAALGLLGEAQQGEPEAFARSESVLVDAARVHSVPHLRGALIHWSQLSASERVGAEEALRSRRRLDVFPAMSAMVRMDGDLDPLNGGSVLTALNSVLDAEARSGAPDDRTPAQRRADALGEICRQWLDRSDRPSIAGERPHLSVTVPAEALVTTGTGALKHGGQTSPAELRRIACDASVTRVVLSGESQPMDVGRRTRVVSTAVRRALVLRDRECRFPGCGRPEPWCDAHHVVHWADGGSTSLDNLVLLCRRHHGSVHEPDGFTVAMEAGEPVFRMPDGSVMEDRAPP